MSQHKANPTITKTEKRDLLAQLAGEVADIHPYLEILFQKLPRITAVNYTHGNNEKGADFVLTRTEDLLGQEEYVGVIVKKGKIHQDLHKIENQIDECDAERVIGNGKKKIRLDEIWIVTNETITSGAIGKINRKFSTRKIKFFQANDLIELTDRYLSNYWFKIPTEIGDYLNRLNLNVSEFCERISLIKGTGSDAYIEQDIIEHHKWQDVQRRTSKKRTHKNRTKKESIIDVIFNNKLIIVEGKPGFGKSRLLTYVASYFSSPTALTKHSLLPLWIEYKTLIEDYDGQISKFVEDSLPQYNATKGTSDFHFLFLIDGVDEKVLSIEEQVDKLSEVIDLIQESQSAKAVITTRPINILDDQFLLDAKVKKYELTPLSFPKIIKFFNFFCKSLSLSNRIIEDLKKSDLFRELPQSPIAAILLAELINENSEDLPSNLTELYSKYIELMLGRWDMTKGLQSQKEFEASVNIVANLSAYFFENDLTQISSQEAKGYFHTYLNERNFTIDADKLFEKLTTRSGILQKTHNTDTVYFKHRTFLEYFYAQHLHKTTQDECIDERVYDPYWRNIFFFYIGQKKDCYSTLDKILSITPSKPVEAFFRVINLADYFLAGYATPYKIVTDNLYRLMFETSQMYWGFVNNEIDASPNELPPIQLLWFFQAVIRSNYSYKYFKEAIEVTQLEIVTNNNFTDDEKAMALLFISFIALEQKIENPFDYLITEFRGKMPLYVELALFHEGKLVAEPSKLLKKHIKKLQKKLDDTNTFYNYVKSLHEKPIKAIE